MTRLRRAWAAIRETVLAIVGAILSRWDAWRNPPSGGGKAA